MSNTGLVPGITGGYYARWLPNANEIDTNDMKCTCPTFRFVLGVTRILAVFRYQHVGIRNAILRIGGISQREDPTFLHRSGI